MVPLIDIVFLLLVFFIYAMLSMSVHRGLRVELPEAATAAVDNRARVEIIITRNGGLMVDGSPAVMEELSSRVRAARDGGRSVFISGDRRAPLGLAVEVLDRLRLAGVYDVSFETLEAAR